MPKNITERILRRMQRIASPIPKEDTSHHLPNDPLVALLAHSQKFDLEQRAIKNRLKFANPSHVWYPHNTLGRLLRGEYRDILALIGDKPIGDIGAADGDMAFFLESVGVKHLHIFDHIPISCNAMEGARLLKQERNSKIEIHDLNLDSFFTLPIERFGVIFFAGLLYHLKNPYYSLEYFAKHTEYMFFNTRIFSRLPGGSKDLRNEPVAYFLEADELNGDSSNFWIFTEASLKRLFIRTGWEILQFTPVDNTRDARPDAVTEGGRAFCLLKSRVFK
jgi:tRNA (mo5U34)-methyltransferase